MKGCLWVVTFLMAFLCGAAGYLVYAGVSVSANGATQSELLGAGLICSLLGALPGGILLVVAHFTETPEPTDIGPEEAGQQSPGQRPGNAATTRGPLP